MHLKVKYLRNIIKPSLKFGAGGIDREKKNFPTKIRYVTSTVLEKCPILTILPVFINNRLMPTLK